LIGEQQSWFRRSPCPPPSGLQCHKLLWWQAHEPDAPELTVIQERQRRVGGQSLAAALAQLERPFAYLDFETINPAIPVWDGCRPYDQVPVQLSVHREGRDGRLIHHAWLADGPSDPRETLARKLIQFVRSAKTILAYNAPFGQRCVRELQEQLLHLAEELGEVEERIELRLPPGIQREVLAQERCTGAGAGVN
jgi:hypothetical protein